MSSVRAGLLLLLVGFVVGCAAPQVIVTEPEDPAPPAEPAELLGMDPAVRMGSIPNGLRYYVRRNEEPLNRAELRLVVNAGSILEDEDQQGLAHLLEHMAFNGTERFPELELVTFLESIGMRFGPDLNAYTSFDETVYMLQVPTDDAELLSTGITVLREWAGSITLREQDIDDERGVVLEEWRQGRGAGARIRDVHFPVLFAESRYAERLPIGRPEVITGAPAERVQAFYRDWYRPDLMAVIAVGDFDLEDVEAQIRQRFGDLTNPADAPERVEYGVPSHDDTRIAIASDAEQTMSTVQLLRKLSARPRLTTADFRELLVDGLYSQMINARLREITQRPGAPFLGGGAFRGGSVRAVDPAGMTAVAPDGGVPRALEALLIEAERVRRHGFTEGELQRARADVMRAYERAYEEREQRHSRAFASELIAHFLQDRAMPGIERELALVRDVLPTITLEEVDARAEVVADASDRVVLVAVPDRDDIPSPSEAELLDILERVRAADIEPYEDEVVAEALIAQPPMPRSIVDESKYEDDGIIEWTLPNGVAVVVKQTDFRNDEILMSAFRPGGTSLASDDIYHSASQAATAVRQGGVADFSATGLERVMAGRTVQVSPYIGQTEEGVSGQASPGDLEAMLQLVHLYFTEPRRDADAFAAHLERTETLLRNRAASPTTAFSDTLTVILSQGHPRSRPMSVEDLAHVDLDEALQFYRERFSDASGFTFVFVGAVDPADLEPLVERYLATLPSAPGAVHEAVDLGIRPPGGLVERVVYRGLEPQARVVLVFSGQLQHDPSRFDPLTHDAEYIAETEAARLERFALGALAQSLQIRLREELREERGGVYGVGVNASPNRHTGVYTISVSFATDPERTEELIEAVYAEIEAFRDSGPDDGVINRVVEGMRRSEETELRANRHWRSALTTAYRFGEQPSAYLYGGDLRARLTRDLIRQTAEAYIDPERVVRVVLLPEDRIGG